MNAPSAPSCENTACEPSFHSSWNIEPPGGLTAVAKKFLPNARASPVRTFATASTPGAFATALAAAIGIGSKLFCAVIA